MWLCHLPALGLREDQRQWHSGRDKAHLIFCCFFLGEVMGEVLPSKC